MVSLFFSFVFNLFISFFFDILSNSWKDFSWYIRGLSLVGVAQTGPKIHLIGYVDVASYLESTLLLLVHCLRREDLDMHISESGLHIFAEVQLSCPSIWRAGLVLSAVLLSYCTYTPGPRSIVLLARVETARLHLWHRAKCNDTYRHRNRGETHSGLRLTLSTVDTQWAQLQMFSSFVVLILVLVTVIWKRGFHRWWRGYIGILTSL